MCRGRGADWRIRETGQGWRSTTTTATAGWILLSQMMCVRNSRFGIWETRNLREVGASSGLAGETTERTFSGMGIDFRDYDNYGSPDVFITDLALQNWALFRNVKGQFQYASAAAGIVAGQPAALRLGRSFVDLDNSWARQRLIRCARARDG